MVYIQVHIIVGIGSFDSNLEDDEKGVMADIAASPNDPIFINHHTMIDCILEEWLRGHPDADYPPNIMSTLKGHQKDGYIVPFFPLFKHKDMFKTADNFGYSCNLLTTVPTGPAWLGWLLIIVASACTTVIFICVVLCLCWCRSIDQE